MNLEDAATAAESRSIAAAMSSAGSIDDQPSAQTGEFGRLQPVLTLAEERQCEQLRSMQANAEQEWLTELAELPARVQLRVLMLRTEEQAVRARLPLGSRAMELGNCYKLAARPWGSVPERPPHEAITL